MTTDPSELPLTERLRRLMQLGGDAAAADPDTAAFDTLNVAATVWGNPDEPGLAGEIARWHLAGRPDAETSQRRMRGAVWAMMQHNESQTGIPATLIDVSADVEERLRELELEQGHDDA